jgi:hypothetical protein
MAKLRKVEKEKVFTLDCYNLRMQFELQTKRIGEIKRKLYSNY